MLSEYSVLSSSRYELRERLGYVIHACGASLSSGTTCVEPDEQGDKNNFLVARKA